MTERQYCLLGSKQWAMTSVNDKNCFALSCDTKHVLLRKTLILWRILQCDTAYREHCARGVITEHRARLLPDNAEKLIFYELTMLTVLSSNKLFKLQTDLWKVRELNWWTTVVTFCRLTVYCSTHSHCLSIIDYLIFDRTFLTSEFWMIYRTLLIVLVWLSTLMLVVQR